MKFFSRTKATMKTDGGQEYGAGAYLIVPDPENPVGWKLRIEETPGEVTVAQLGRAAAALGPGFRGQRVDLNDNERGKAARKLIRLYRRNGVEDGDIPEHLWSMAGMEPAEKALRLGQIIDMVHRAWADQMEDDGNGWLADVFEDHIIVERRGEFYRVAYSLQTAAPATNPEAEAIEAVLFAPEAEWVRVVPAFVEFKTYQRSDGRPRWLAVTSGGFRDRDGEIVSTEFLRSAVKAADASGRRGPLLLYHVPGSNIGTCDYQAVVGNFLLESGEFDDTPAGWAAAAYFQEKGAGYGASIKFLYLNRSADGVYAPPGVILERSLLPRDKAAFPWSTINLAEVMSMAQIDKEKREELERVLGADIAAEVIGQLEASSEQLKEAGVAWKEAAEAEETEPEPAAAEKEAGEQPEAEPLELVLGPEALEAVAEKARQAFSAEFAGVEAALAGLSAVTEQLAVAIKALQASDDARIAEKVAHLPRATVRHAQVHRPTQAAREKAAEDDEPENTASLQERGLATLYGG